MENPGFYQTVFSGRWKFPQARITENYAIKKIFIALWESDDEWP